MKLKRFNLMLLFCAGMTVQAFSQTAEQRNNIIKDYDQKTLSQMTQEFADQFEKEKQQAYDYAIRHNIPTIIQGDDGRFSVLRRMNQRGQLEYMTTYGKADAKTIQTDKLYPGGGLGLALEGEGMIGGVWDAGKVKETHELLNGQVILKDSGNGPSPNHATHVTGTMVGKELPGSGNAGNARGMAYKAIAHAYDWNSDLSEMTSEAAQGLLVSNHSYGLDLSQVGNPATIVGNYDQISQATDNLMYNAKYYTVVTAAGNDRQLNYNPTENGYNILGGWMATAKNSIVVAAVEEIFFGIYTGPGSVKMSAFSSWGPTNDNRVKPDISAQGVGVISSVADSNTSYSALSGTSMASPGVAGSILLLQELSADLNNGDFLKSSTIKAILINTVLQADDVPGPNPRYGWGLMSTGDAAQLMLDSHEGVNQYYDELELNQTQTGYNIAVKANADGELKATIAWTDKGGSGLINDLDMRITDEQGNTFYPWRLDPTNYANPPLRNGDNFVDNVEQVWVENAVEGQEYTITISHKGSLFNDKQEFGIAISGIQNTPTLGVDKHELTGVSLYPNPAENFVNIDLAEVKNNLNLAIYDLNGRKVMENNVRLNASSHQLDISRLKGGIYFIKIESDGKTTTQKLIVK